MIGEPSAWLAASSRFTPSARLIRGVAFGPGSVLLGTMGQARGETRPEMARIMGILNCSFGCLELQAVNSSRLAYLVELELLGLCRRRRH